MRMRESTGIGEPAGHSSSPASDTPLERMYRHARLARIYDGPDEVHRMTVARRILREYRAGDGWDFGAA